MTSTTISSIPQWQLLQAVSPVFSSPDLKWEPLYPGPSHSVVTNDSIKLFRHHLSQIPLYIHPEDELSHIHHELFVLTAGTLLSMMQETVAPDIPQASGIVRGLDQDPLYSNEQLQKKWPRLLGLAYLQHKGQEWAGHLVLRQDPSVFKGLQAEAILFVNLAKLILPGDVDQMTKPSGEPSSSQKQHRQGDSPQVRELFCGYSKRLFAGIVRRLAGCQLPHSQSPHRALLHLKGPSDAHDGQPAPKLTMFVAFCPERNTWQQVVCTEHMAGSGSALTDSSRDVGDICKLARSCSENDCILGVELNGDTLLDTSDQSMDEDPESLDDSSTIKFTLDELLRRGIFETSYKVFPNDKKILAYILARALLYLYGGPWLQTPWTADKLVFRYQADTQTIYNVHQPYIMCDLREDPPPPVAGIMHHCPPVLAFAKILVDLDQGCTDEMSGATDGALFKAVKKYYNEKKDTHLSPAYTQALYSSIFFNKYFKDIQGKNPHATIQDAILEGIVKPLEKDVHMDIKDQWGCRNVTLKNNTLVMAQPTVPQRPPERKLPGTPHPTSAPSRTPRTASNTNASRLSAHPASARPRPASRPVTPTSRPVAASRTTGTKSAARHNVHNAVPTKPMTAPCTITSIHAQSSRSNVPEAANVGHIRSRKMPDVGVNEMRSGSMNGQKSTYFEPDRERGSFCRVPASDSSISTTTFRHMNSVADKYLQHTEDDTPIRVAVIDTGIDLGHADFQRARPRRFSGHEPRPAQYERPQKDRILACKNFCKDQPEDDVSDLDGHGTQVAGIILRLAPNAELYIARVCTGNINFGVERDKMTKSSNGMVATPELEAVTKAIAWALGEGVDIINLSLGFRQYLQRDIDELQTRLRSIENTIIFAAASNGGLHEEVAWPARDESVAIAIYSSPDSGSSASDFCAPARNLTDNFMTVGENILSQWPTAKGGGFRLCSGTSFATPVATAVGALILAFAHEKGQSRGREQAAKKVNVKELHTMNGLRKVLRGISTRNSSGYHWIHSKLFWRDFVDTDENDEAFQHAWDIITKALR